VDQVAVLNDQAKRRSQQVQSQGIVGHSDCSKPPPPSLTDRETPAGIACHVSVTKGRYELAVALRTRDRTSEAELIDRLQSGDEAAFSWLVDTYSASLKRLALVFVSADAVAEEVVQETWLAVLTGVGRFEGRSSLKTWLFKILTNRAKTRAAREKRTVRFSELEPEDGDGPVLSPERFLPPDDPTFPGHWSTPPYPWSVTVEQSLLRRETMEVLRRGLENLPRAQRTVVMLRDVEGWPADEVCSALELSEANQRVLLHRGRSRLRSILETYFAEDA
jgi:RNA polymerase sigma-70 factor, ECF subfamily